jgi:hypothetical protein
MSQPDPNETIWNYVFHRKKYDRAVESTRRKNRAVHEEQARAANINQFNNNRQADAAAEIVRKANVAKRVAKTAERCALRLTKNRYVPKDVYASYRRSQRSTPSSVEVRYVPSAPNLEIVEADYHPASAPEPVEEVECSRECVICYSEPACYAANPCGHLLTCKACYQPWKKTNPKCPHCRANINSTLRLFM